MNLLLVSVDSLRLDSVSRTNPRLHTPQFDRFADEFCFYDRLFSVSSATRPVHSSLFTGLYPFEHGVEGQQYPRMREGIPSLLDLFSQEGYRVGAYSEAPDIFFGLDFGIQPMANLHRLLAADLNEPTFLFLHYWQTHVPYGDSDNRARGQTLDLLRGGDLATVRARYEVAVLRVFEECIAAVLAKLDLSRWCVIVLGDHGESWTHEEPYHGVTLRNSVLRVPLYLHIPHSGNPLPPRKLLSMVDIFPTLTRLFDLPHHYMGFGLDLRQKQDSDYCLAEIDPLTNGDLLNKVPDELLIGASTRGRQWALFNPVMKMTHYEKSGSDRLEHTFDERPVEDAEAICQMHAACDAMRARSTYARGGIQEGTADEDSLLAQRLRDLGYL
jgi:membrane-anchored protein YejM (alkaline phosphatase superfamily)